MQLLTSCLQRCKQIMFSKNTSYFYVVRISISLAILSEILVTFLRVMQENKSRCTVFF